MQVAFCRHFETDRSAIQDLLDWGAANLAASFDEADPATNDDRARDIVAHLEAHASFFAAHAGATTVLHSRVSGPAAPPEQHLSAVELAHVAVAVIDGFYLTCGPPTLGAAPEPVVRRKLEFASSLGTFLAPRQGIQAVACQRLSCDSPQAVSWYLDDEVDIAPRSHMSEADGSFAHHYASQAASQASLASPRRASQASLGSYRNRSDAASVASLRKGSAASMAGRIEHDDGGSVCSDQLAAGQLPVYMHDLQPCPVFAPHHPPQLAARAVDLEPPVHGNADAPAGKLQFRVLSALRSLVLPSCMRPVLHSGSHPRLAGPGCDGGPQQHDLGDAYACSTPATEEAAPSGIKRSRSFEEWIRLQEPVTPTPSFHALQNNSYSSGSTESAAARTAQWVSVVAAQPLPQPAAGAAPHAGPAAAPPASLAGQQHQQAEGPAASAAAGGSMCGEVVAHAPQAAPQQPSEQEDSWAAWLSQHHTLSPLRMPGTQSATATLSAPAPPLLSSLAVPSPNPPAPTLSPPAPSPPSTTSLSIPAPSPSSDSSPPPLVRMTPALHVPASPPAYDPPRAFNIAPPEIMDPATPPSLSRGQTLSPSIAFLRRSVGSWASDSPSQSTLLNTVDLTPTDRPASPFSAGLRAASWASELSRPNSHHSRSSTPTHRAASPGPAPQLPSADDYPAGAPALSPLTSGPFAALRRDSWSSDYSAPSPSAARVADTAFANYQHQQPGLQPNTPPQHNPPSSSGLSSMRSLPQVPSRLGARRNFLSRAASARSGVLATITTSLSDEADVADDTGDAIAAPGGSGSAAEQSSPGERSSDSQDSDIDTHFFSDRGTTITMSADLETLGALVPAPSAPDADALHAALSTPDALHSAFSAPDAMFHYDAIAAEHYRAAAPPPPAAHATAAETTAAVPDAPGPTSSDLSESSGRGGLSGLSVRLGLGAPRGSGASESSEEEEDEAPETLRHFGSFTGTTEPVYLAGTRSPAALAAARTGLRPAVVAP